VDVHSTRQDPGAAGCLVATRDAAPVGDCAGSRRRRVPTLPGREIRGQGSQSGISLHQGRRDVALGVSPQEGSPKQLQEPRRSDSSFSSMNCRRLYGWRLTRAPRVNCDFPSSGGRISETCLPPFSCTCLEQSGVVLLLEEFQESAVVVPRCPEQLRSIVVCL